MIICRWLWQNGKEWGQNNWKNQISLTSRLARASGDCKQGKIINSPERLKMIITIVAGHFGEISWKEHFLWSFFYRTQFKCVLSIKEPNFNEKWIKIFTLASGVRRQNVPTTKCPNDKMSHCIMHLPGEKLLLGGLF